MAKEKQPNMKVNVTADNSDLSRKMKDSKAAVKDFEKVSGDALKAFGSAIGVNIDQISRLSNSLKGLGEKMQKSGNDAAKSMGKIVSALGSATTAIAGLGIGAAVAAFKLLNDEATAFKNTVQGASVDLQTTAFVATYAQALRDANEAVGENTATIMSELTKKWKTLWADVKFIAVDAIADIATGELEVREGMLKSMAALPGLSGILGPATVLDAAGTLLGKSLDTLQGLKSEAIGLGESAARIEERMYNIRLKMVDKTVEWARMERQIAEYKRIAYDKSVDTATQQEALNKATQLIEQRYKEEARLKKQLADLQFQYNDLASSSLEDIQKANQLRVDEENTVARMNNALRELSERQATIRLNAEKEAEAREQALEYAEAMAKSRAELADWAREAGLDKPIVPDIEIPPVEVKVDDSNVKLPDVTVGVKLPIDELQQSVTELSPLLSEAFDEVSDAVQPAQQMSSIFQVAADVVAGMSDDIAAIAGGLKAISTTTSASVLATYDGPADIKSLLPKGAEALTETGLAIPITPELDMSGVVDITNELQSVMTSAFDTIGVSIGELIGDLATGGDAWGNFANTAIGAFGDMAISIGKMAISTGVATLGIKAALESLNGYVAIAAGTALVALGAAVKAGLSNIASGSYSSSANVATAGGYGSTSMLGSDFETREMKVEVTGTLRASGNELLTVIENENTRKRHTT